MWQPVELITTDGPVALTSPVVSTKLVNGSIDSAEITVGCIVTNWGTETTTGLLTIEIEGVGKVQQTVAGLTPGKETTVQFSPSNFPVLKIKNPSLWWPWQMGA